MARRNRDIAGLLTGIPSGGFAQNMMEMSRELGTKFGSGITGMMTGDIRTPTQQLTGDIKNFANLTPERKQAVIGGLQARGQTAVANQLLAGEQQRARKMAEDARREKLIETAKSLKLDLTVDLLQSGGDMTEALEQIRKAQESDVLKKQGRKGKVAIANNRNVGAPMLKAIGQGDYDSLSNEEFLKVLSGEKATLKVYTDATGQARPFRVNESGRVYNADTEKWALPSELGLTQAAQLTKTITDADRIASKLKDKATDNFLIANEKALSAQKVLEINANSRSLMEEGIITGAGANFLAGMASIGTQLGIVPQGVTDSLVATQTFMAERGKQVLALLGSGDVGAGTGISDKDVQFMKEVAGQQITLNKETLSRIMRIEEQAARNAIAKNNQSLEIMKQYVGADEDSALLDTFFVPMPEPTVTGYVPTQAAKSYLEQARQRRTP